MQLDTPYLATDATETTKDAYLRATQEEPRKKPKPKRRGAHQLSRQLSGVADHAKARSSHENKLSYSRGPFLAAMFLLVFWILFWEPWWSRFVGIRGAPRLTEACPRHAWQPQGCCACVGQAVVCRASSLHLSLLRQKSEKMPIEDILYWLQSCRCWSVSCELANNPAIKFSHWLRFFCPLRSTQCQSPPFGCFCLPPFWGCILP